MQLVSGKVEAMRRNVDVLPGQGSVFGSPGLSTRQVSESTQLHSYKSYLAISIGLIGVVLVVPVLEVLVDGSLLSCSVLATHGSETTTSLGRLAMQSLVEGGIARDILALKSSRGHGEEWNGG